MRTIFAFAGFISVSLCFSLAHGTDTASLNIPEPGQRDTCPVCGMFVAPHADWAATVFYGDGVSHHFDGAKDFFTYLLDMQKWAQGRDVGTIQLLLVKEYYGLTRIDARTAYYVTGSDTMGPMGHELIPFASLEEAESFKRDHRGKEILRFSEIDKNTISALGKGPMKGAMK